ncbi:MAG: hypothetical protein AB8C46_20610 [Burkholderiaceae bacterium]
MNRLMPRRYVVDKLIGALVVVVAIFAVYAAWQVRTADRQQAQVDSALAGENPPAQTSAAVRIAHAIYLTREQQFEPALKIYQAVESARPDAQTIHVARYNAANLNMREAFSLIANDERGRALPLIEVAKQIYRQLLRDRPYDNAVRYNLSRALLLVPDPVAEPEGLSPPNDAERAITTMRGFSPGLP